MYYNIYIYFVHRRSFQATAGSTTSKYTVGVTTNDVPELQQIHRVAFILQCDSLHTKTWCKLTIATWPETSPHAYMLVRPSACKASASVCEPGTKHTVQAPKRLQPLLCQSWVMTFMFSYVFNFLSSVEELDVSCATLCLCHAIRDKYDKGQRQQQLHPCLRPPKKTTNDSQDKSACATSPRKKENKLTWRFNTQPTWRKLSNTIQISPTSVKSIDFPSRPHADARRPLRKSTCNS